MKITCVCSHVPLQVKGVIETFAAVPAGVPLDEAVALQVTGQHALQWENLMAHGAQEITRTRGRGLWADVNRKEKSDEKSSQSYPKYSPSADTCLFTFLQQL